MCSLKRTVIGEVLGTEGSSDRDPLEGRPARERTRLGTAVAVADGQHVTGKLTHHHDRAPLGRCAWNLQAHSVAVAETPRHATERVGRNADVAGEPQGDMAPKAPAIERID